MILISEINNTHLLLSIVIICYYNKLDDVKMFNYLDLTAEISDAVVQAYMM